MIPLRACNATSYPGSLLLGPSLPYAEIEQRITSSGIFPIIRSSVPGLKFSTTTSASLISSSKSSVCCFKFIVMISLPRLHARKYAATSFPSKPVVNGGPHFLVSSPHGASTLITSAPKSASICVHNGPARILDKSTILTPSNIPFMANRSGLGRLKRCFSMID